MYARIWPLPFCVLCVYKCQKNAQHDLYKLQQYSIRYDLHTISARIQSQAWSITVARIHLRRYTTPKGDWNRMIYKHCNILVHGRVYTVKYIHGMVYTTARLLVVYHSCKNTVYSMVSNSNNSTVKRKKKLQWTAKHHQQDSSAFPAH
jgi:hypothetical protein